MLTHLKSAALTFAAALGVELYAATSQADSWGELTWQPLLSAATFAAARAALKLMLSTGTGTDKT